MTPSSAADNAPSPWWRGAVIYQVYPRSFRDSNGDGVGDLPGLLDGLEHIAALGVDGVWLSPFFPSPMDDFGYDVAEYCGVDPLFGTLEDFDRVVARAHELGLKLIIDQVYSHTSDRHEWFKQSRRDRNNPKADWYVWADPKPDGSPPSNWQSVFGGPAWQWDGPRKQYYLHNFLTSQPDLNLHNKEVQDALLDAARFWLDRGVDGFRLDALNFAMHDPGLRDNPPSDLDIAMVTRPFDMQLHIHNQSHPDIPLFLERLSGVMAAYGTIFTVAEVVGDRPREEMRAFTQGHRRLSTAYGFDFLYAEELTAETVRQALRQWGNAPEDGWPSWAFSNHDAPRAVTRWAAPEDREKAARCLMLLLLGMRGNVFLYEGEELGLPQGRVAFEDLQDPEAIANWPHTLGRDGARTPIPWQAAMPQGGFTTGIPWLPVDPAHLPLAIDHQAEDPQSMLRFTRALLDRRKHHPALVTGELELLDTPEDILAFFRQEGPETILCVYNLTPEKQRWRPDTAFGKFRRLAGTADTAEGPPPEDLPPWSGYWALPEEA